LIVIRKLIYSLSLLAAAISAHAFEFYRDNFNTPAMAVDAAGNVYLTGYALMTSFGPVYRENPFLIKLDPTGAPVYTINFERDFNGMAGIHISGVAVDGAGSVYLTGSASQSGLRTVNAVQPVFGGMSDAFVAKLKPDGSGFVYLTYLGGSGPDTGRQIAVDHRGSTYVTGSTCSTKFPTVNAAQASFGGKGQFGCDAFVTKLDPAGDTLIYSTYLGGSRDEQALAISADSAGNAYVGGFTASIDFPTTNPLQAELASCSPTNLTCSDAFIVKLNTSGAIVYSTYLGGIERDEVNGIAIDAAGNAYVAGITATDFPTAKAFQLSSGNPSNCGDCAGAFVAKLNPAGESVYSTYVSGSRQDRASAIAVDTDGNAYVTGGAATPANSPQTPGATGAFVAKLNAGGSLCFLPSSALRYPRSGKRREMPSPWTAPARST
jgi:hypothetical protein